MKLWTISSWVIGIGIVALMGSILFAPLPLLSRYGLALLMTVIILGAVSLVHSLLVFVKETPKRRWAEPKTDASQPMFLNLKLKTWKNIGEWALMLIVLFVLWQFQHGNLGSRECPDIVRGNPSSSIRVQYFYSPFCPACWKGEQIMQRLVAKRPDVRFENFDVRYCGEVMFAEGVRGSPAYHVKNANMSETTYGTDVARVEQEVCSLLGGCP